MGDWFLEVLIDNRELELYYPYHRNQQKGNIMADNSTTVFVTGTLYWPKIVGERALHPTYEKDGREWSYELVPDDTSFLKEHGLLDRLKDKEDAKNPEKGDFLVLRKPEFTYEGKPNDPIRIYNDDNEPWGDQTLIGNGTRADVKLRIVDWGKGKKKGIYTTAIRITDLVPYETDEFGAMDSEKEDTPAKAKKAAKPKTKADAGNDFDDDVPF